MNRKFQILLIDDNPIDVMVLKKTFFNLNADCTFTEFEDAEKALSYLQVIKEDKSDSLPDIIISDLVLPKMSGNELLAALKDDDIFKSIPFVMFTNSSSELDIKKAYSQNVNSYIVKPLSLNIYKETIRSFWNFWANSVRLPDHHDLVKRVA
jgi:CheY-like chemotaxis protein